MSLKTFYVFLIFLFSIITPVFAQDQASSDEHQRPSADDIISKMQSKLNLTQDQLAAVSPIIEKYTSKREELRQSMQDGSADHDSLRSQMKQLKADENQELSQFLSSDQMSQWEQMQGRHKHSGMGGGEQPQGDEDDGAGN